jgi:adenosine kinase
MTRRWVEQRWQLDNIIQANGMDWETTGRLASLIGAWKIAQRGGQNHKFTRDEIAARYKQSFNATLW